MRRLAEHLGNELSYMTYADGVRKVDLRKELELHKQHGKLATMTASPGAFRDAGDQARGRGVPGKAAIDVGWINGGFCGRRLVVPSDGFPDTTFALPPDRFTRA
jgi:glucose-1-phosphate cytidylyltransferase